MMLPPIADIHWSYFGVCPQRVDAAKSRVESLNPLVTVEIIPTSSVLEREGLDAIVQAVDLVCVTDWDRDGLVSAQSPL